SRVFYRDANCIVAVTFSSYPQNSISICCGSHCFDCVIDQVVDNLLQLHPVAIDDRQFGCQLAAGCFTSVIEFSLERLQYAENHRVHVDLLSLLILLPEQGAKAVEHSAGTMDITIDLIQDLPSFVVIGWRPAEKSHCCSSVHCDRTQGLS